MSLTAEVWMDIFAAPASEKSTRVVVALRLAAALALAGNAKFPLEVGGQRWNFFPSKVTDPRSSVQPRETLGC